MKKLIKIDSVIRDKNTRLVSWGLKPIPHITVFGAKEVTGHEVILEGPAMVFYNSKLKVKTETGNGNLSAEDCWIETNFPVVLFNQTTKIRERIL